MGVTWGGGLLALHAREALVAVLQHFAVRLLLSQDTGQLTGQLTSPSPQVASAQPAMVNKVVCLRWWWRWPVPIWPPTGRLPSLTATSAARAWLACWETMVPGHSGI